MQNKTNKLMIVSHPDDEVIFGGSALLEEEGWRVVCLTNGNNPLRRKTMKGGQNKKHSKFRNLIPRMTNKEIERRLTQKL
jgi:LmbE family N-acetylglucosaminyl deacetylase